MLIFFSVFAAGCDDGSDHLSINVLGADVGIYYVNEMAVPKTNQKEINAKINDLANDINATFSVEEKSAISDFNGQNGARQVLANDALKYIYERSFALYSETDGAFDPSAKLLVDLWGFSARYSRLDYVPELPFDRERLSDGGFALPDKKYVDAFKSLADFSKISVRKVGEKFYLTGEDDFVTVDGTNYYTALDFSAVLKGYFVDEVQKIVADHGIDDYYVSAGGSSLYLGNVNGGEWDLTVVDPFTTGRKCYLSVKIKDKFVSTSGSYENFYTVDGKNYCHIIDCSTGAPTESDIVSCTIIGDDGLLTDGLSTALVVMGSERALSFLQGKTDVDYVLILSDGTVLSDISERITYLK